MPLGHLSCQQGVIGGDGGDGALATRIEAVGLVAERLDALPVEDVLDPLLDADEGLRNRSAPSSGTFSSL